MHNTSLCHYFQPFDPFVFGKEYIGNTDERLADFQQLSQNSMNVVDTNLSKQYQSYT